MNMALPGVFFLSLADGNKRMLNCMGWQRGPMILQLIVSISHIGLCYVLTILSGLGVYGPALSSTLSNLCLLIMMTIYTQRITDPRVKQAWFPPTADSISLRGLVDFMKVGLPSVIMICFEWWAFEIMAILAA